jgi:alanine racemase
MTRPIRARIDLAALRHNHGMVRHRVGAARIWSVIKANAYGHGVCRVARALEADADGFALIELDAAVALRDSGIRQPLLMLEGCYDAHELPVYAAHGLTPVLHRIDQVTMVAKSGMALAVYLKLDTGMHRLGLNAAELRIALDTLRSKSAVSDIRLMTHFADADEPVGIAEQMRALRAMTVGLDLSLSLANSAALLRFPESHAHWVRPGIMLYGASPFPQMQSAAELGLRPVMTLESELIAVRDLAVGDRVGYGGAFAADRPMRIGIVACGYGDGYPRHAKSGTPILVAGVRTRTVGRVSMDKICVDLAKIPHAEVGTAVTLWGDGLSADEVATAAGTVSYELFCALADRVPVAEV